MQDQIEISENEPPYLQRLCDRPFLWLILGFVVMFIFYTAWGLLEIFTLPKATLP